MEAFLVPTTVILLYSSYNILRGNILLAPVAYVAACTLLSYMAWVGLFSTPFYRNWSNRGAAVHGSSNFQYFLVILTLYTSTYLLVSTRSARRGKILSDVGELIPRIAQQVPEKAVRLATVCLVLLTALYFIVADFGIIWMNNRYLAIGTPLDHGVSGGFAAFIIQMIGPVSIFSWALLPFAVAKRMAVTALILGVSCFVLLSIQLAGHSRYSAVLVGVCGLMAIFQSRRSLRAFGILCLLLFPLNLAHSLIGRGGDVHGLVTLPTYLSTLKSMSQLSPNELFGSFFEGVFVQGEVFYYTGYEFPEIYETLSFSPLPSFIDGFAQNARHYKVGFRSYVPMGATGEAYLFGDFFLVFYYLVTCGCYAVMLRSARGKPRISTIFSLAILMLGVYLQFSYPIRSVLRFFLLAAILSYIAPFLGLILKAGFGRGNGKRTQLP
ncbi:hypothetical protein [Vannielia litorea]|uniref:hypothetical protein n=1 Tax=Vannielia litorea TaxID=1217970 RepID=UPI001BD1B6FB|nr:hypothetical protein [Vannielia litorea]